MTAEEAIAFIREHGVVLASGKGPVPRLTEVIVRAPIKGSWWAHPRSRHIFAILRAVSASKDILVCRIVEGKVSLVHRRLWPALVRVAYRFPPNRISQVREEHTAAGYHQSKEIAYPEWVSAEVKEQARAIGEEEALHALGSWAFRARPSLDAARRKQRPL
jgi:hypothetical protein